MLLYTLDHIVEVIADEWIKIERIKDFIHKTGRKIQKNDITNYCLTPLSCQAIGTRSELKSAIMCFPWITSPLFRAGEGAGGG